MYHNYTKKDVDSCLVTNGNRLTFIGDSRLRQNYQRTLSFYENNTGISYVHKTHEDHDHPSLPLSFRWATKPEEISAAFAKFSEGTDKTPEFIVLESGLWTVKNVEGTAGLNEFSSQMKTLKEHLDKFMRINPKSQVMWMMMEDTRESELRDDRKIISVENIKKYNDIVEDALSHVPAVKIMKTNRKIAEQDKIGLSNDGLHFLNDDETTGSDHGFSAALNEVVLMIFNVFCNDEIRPADASCCLTAEKTSSVQYVMAILAIAAATAYFIYQKRENAVKQALGYQQLSGDDVEAAPAEKKQETPAHIVILFNLCKFALIMYYFWLCDRSTTFAFKANKHYSFTTFLIGMIAIIISCCFFGAISKVKRADLLNREQTSEWKGWMQVFILLYHITGASAHVPVYMHIRLLVAAYLFQTGYGHTCYAFFKADYSFSRIMKVMFRLSFLTTPLCWVMNRPYQFYYFVPLCAFWFTLYYCWLWIPFFRPEKLGADNGPQVLKLMSMKVVGFVGLIILMFLNADWFQLAFSVWPLRPMFELPGGSGKLYEWYFRAQLDRFAVPVGAAVAVFYFYAKQKSWINEKIEDGKTYICEAKHAKIIMTISACVVILYTGHLTTCSDKKFCNFIHVFVSGFYILAFVALRNIPDSLRNYYSHRFAWFGNISLELFIGQFHIWLAQDTRGILVFFPAFPLWLNMMISSVTFVCIAHEIHEITEALAAVLIPKDNYTLYVRTMLITVVIVVLSDDARALVGI
jgi:hypothetical protein